MNMSLKRYVFIITSVLTLLSTAVLASEPADKTHPMMVTPDYQPINVNQASASQIAVVLKSAELQHLTAILAYSKANGLFKTADSLMSVKGVGRLMLGKNGGVIAAE
jgi:competence ComEA-like helix-hairpin-helix protein